MTRWEDVWAERRVRELQEQARARSRATYGDGTEDPRAVFPDHVWVPLPDLTVEGLPAYRCALTGETRGIAVTEPENPWGYQERPTRPTQWDESHYWAGPERGHLRHPVWGAGTTRTFYGVPGTTPPTMNVRFTP